MIGKVFSTGWKIAECFRKRLYIIGKGFSTGKRLSNILGKDKKLSVKRCMYLTSETKSM